MKRLSRSWIGGLLETVEFGGPTETGDAAAVPGSCEGTELSEELGCRTMPVDDRVVPGSTGEWYLVPPGEATDCLGAWLVRLWVGVDLVEMPPAALPAGAGLNTLCRAWKVGLLPARGVVEWGGVRRALVCP